MHENAILDEVHHDNFLMPARAYARGFGPRSIERELSATSITAHRSLAVGGDST